MTSTEQSGGEPAPSSGERATSLWLGVGLAFAALIGMWVALFVIAARHPVESVPVERTIGDER